MSERETLEVAGILHNFGQRVIIDANRSGTECADMIEESLRASLEQYIARTRPALLENGRLNLTEIQQYIIVSNMLLRSPNLRYNIPQGGFYRLPILIGPYIITRFNHFSNPLEPTRWNIGISHIARNLCKIASDYLEILMRMAINQYANQAEIDRFVTNFQNAFMARIRTIVYEKL